MLRESDFQNSFGILMKARGNTFVKYQITVLRRCKIV